jgi:hypothetical protein
MVRKLPILDPSETWHYQAETNAYVTLPSETIKTKKVPKAFVKAAATKEHPAQVETFTEDIVVGHWKTVKFSGAIPQKQVTELLERITRLGAAVKFAREDANSIEVKARECGKTIFDHLFGTVAS